MPENNTKKKNNKGTITEKDIATLLQRYTATTVLTLLQEVAQCSGDKIDWNELVRNTSTGITDAREYRMLWRHLAYRGSVSDDLEDGAQHLDDDSDLEYELEADPSVSYEASSEAAACVKVMMASGLSSDSSMPNCSTIEAPLTINIPNGDSSGVSNEKTQPACSVQGVNITVPVSVQKQTLPASIPSAGPVNYNTTSASLASRKRRKKWSTEEDMELIAAVQKCGEGNWANILRGDFKGDRTASQLSQRWSTLRRRKGETNIPGTSSTVPQLTEAQLAARHAMSVALGTPSKNLTSGSGAGGASLMSTSNIAARPTVAEALPRGKFAYGQHQFQQAPVASKSTLVGSVGLSEKSLAKKVLPRSNLGSDSVIATAVAAGARIVTPSDASTLLKAAQAKTAMHISPAGGTSKKLPMVGGIPTKQAHTPVATPHTNHPAGISSTSHTVKAASPKLQHAPSAAPSKVVAELNVGARCGVGGINSSNGIEVSKLKEVPKVVKEVHTLSTKDTIDKQVGEEKAAPCVEAKLRVQVGNVEITSNAVHANEAPNDSKAGEDNPAEGHHRNDPTMGDIAVKGGENPMVKSQKPNTNEKQGCLQSVPVDACSEKIGVSSKVDISNGV